MALDLKMSPDTAHHLLVGAMIAALGIEVYAEFKAGNVPPRPVRFVGVCLVYGILAEVIHISSSIAALLGLGLLAGLIVALPKMGNGGSNVPGFNVYGSGPSGGPGSSGGGGGSGSSGPFAQNGPTPQAPQFNNGAQAGTTNTAQSAGGTSGTGSTVIPGLQNTNPAVYPL